MHILNKDIQYSNILSFLKLLERYRNIDVEDYDRVKNDVRQLEVGFYQIYRYINCFKLTMLLVVI